MNYSLLSKRYNVRKMNTNDVPLILSLCANNVLYYQYYPPFVTKESIVRDLSALPPNKDESDKFYLSYFEGDRLIAVIDLVLAYPNEQTAFIGFFMCDTNVQNKGIGSFIIDELSSYLKTIGIMNIRLAFVKDNPQASHFWNKNNFQQIKIVEQNGISLVVAERKL